MVEKERIRPSYTEIESCNYKLVYATPEKILKSPGLISFLDQLYQTNKIDGFVINEVHCVSHWGEDFRKDYLDLSMLKDRYPKVPILGLTATAT